LFHILYHFIGLSTVVYFRHNQGCQLIQLT